MNKLIVTCVLFAVIGSTLADPDRPGTYLKHDKTVKSCKKYNREANQYQCVLSPFNTEGPYFLPDDHERSDITDGVAGVPLDLKINVVNSNNCDPMEHMYVHIWSTNADGYYSGVGTGPPPGPPGRDSENNNGKGQTKNGPPKGRGEGRPDRPPFDKDDDHSGRPPFGGDDEHHDGPQKGNRTGLGKRPTPVSDERFLRGYQVTDSSGQVSFTTIVPGWYDGRCLHMHIEVYPKDSTAESDILYVGQIFFHNEVVDQLKLIDPYSSNTHRVTRNEDDGIFRNHGNETIIELVSQGTRFSAEMTFGVDPNAKARLNN